MADILTIENVGFGYKKNLTISDIAFSIGESEVVGIIGPNGSGKTTLIKCINRILEPTQGDVLFEKRSVQEMTRREIAKNMGYVPQNSSSSMSMPSVLEVVMMGRAPHSMWTQSSSDEEIVWDALEKLNIKHLANSGFDELSSGQVQRVLIARALVQEAKVMLLDEPTSNLDVKYQLEVMNLIKEVVNSNHVSACTIVHDLNIAMRFCDKIVMMKEGKVEAFGETSCVMTSENIRKIFDVDAKIIEDSGIKHVLICRCELPGCLSSSTNRWLQQTLIPTLLGCFRRYLSQRCFF